MPSLSATALSGVILAGALLGLAIPALYLRRRHRLLHQQCVLGFPSFLDLLLVCCEAGLAPRAGIERVSREIAKTHPFFGANLLLMTLELRAGRAAGGCYRGARPSHQGRRGEEPWIPLAANGGARHKLIKCSARLQRRDSGAAIVAS